MMNFSQFDVLTKSAEDLYKDAGIPPPVQYNLGNYMDLITTKQDNLNCADPAKSRWDRQIVPDNGIAARDNSPIAFGSGPMRTMEVNALSTDPQKSNWQGTEFDSIVATGQKAWGNFGPQLDDEGWKKYNGFTW